VIGRYTLKDNSTFFEGFTMTHTQLPPLFSPENDARDAALWREFAQGVNQCLTSDNGYTSVFGGSDNLSASVQYQSRGRAGMQLNLSWLGDSEQPGDIGRALLAMKESTIKTGHNYERAPLPPGTRISFADIEGVVIDDQGGATLIVSAEGYRAKWYWTFEGESCIILPPSETVN
jgi:hypothetical protein